MSGALRVAGLALLALGAWASASEEAFVRRKAASGHRAKAASGHRAKKFVQGAALKRVSKRAIKAAIKDITDDIGKIELKGNLEKIAVDALLNDVKGVEQLDPNSIGILQNVSLLFSDILDDYQAERNQDQTSLDNIGNTIASCNSAGMALDANVSAQADASNQTHILCRDDELVLFNDDAATCLTFTDFLTHLSSPVCVKPDPTQAQIPAWDTMLSQGDSWFQTTLAGYVPKRNACVATTEALAQKVLDCNLLQNTFETHFCEWHEHRTSMCTTRDSCYLNAVNAQDLLWSQIYPIADVRTREAALILHMQCLLQNLIVGITDITQCIFPDYSGLQDLYNNTNPAYPPKDTCDTTPVDIYPGHTDWYLFAYGDLSVDTPAKENTGIACNV